MIKKMLGVFTSIVAALAVVGVAWASGDDDSTSVTAATETSATVSADVSTPTTEVTLPDSSSSTDANSSTSTSANASTSTSVDDDSASTSTSIAGNTSTSSAAGSSTSTTVGSSTSTSVDDNRSTVPDGITAHTVPGVGTVTIEVFANQLFLVNVAAPGWSVEYDKLESDRIELEFTSSLDAEAEFEARIKDGRVEVRIDVD